MMSIDVTQTSWLLEREVIFLKKKGKDILDVSNFRPISLLETIYKIMSKLLISCFEDGIFASLIKTQFGFVRNKQMSLASHSLLQIISALQTKQIPAALISIDIKAALILSSPPR